MQVDIAYLLILVVGIILGYLFRYIYGSKVASSMESSAKKMVEDAKRESESLKRERLKQLEMDIANKKMKFELELAKEKRKIEEFRKDLDQRAISVEKKFEIIERKEKEIKKQEKAIVKRENDLQIEKAELKKLMEENTQLLEKIAQIDSKNAKQILMRRLEEEAYKELSFKMIEEEKKAKENSERKAREILATAVQRLAANYVQEMTTTTVSLPDDEIKGRIIGREGRNIRAFEHATGVELIVDDTPEIIILSCFDPVKRKIAELSMKRLIADRRIHPNRIENVVKKVKEEFETLVEKKGRDVAYQLGIIDLPKEVHKLLGKLEFRTSYGQSQLQHTLEVVNISRLLAEELGADVKICKRAALLHDIGKAVDEKYEGAHHQISAEIAKKYGEDEKVINIILSHHEGIEEPKSMEAFVVAAADTISASRPGARKESVESYIKRIENLEKIAASFKGIISAHAIQAGRELRVVVEPTVVDEKSTYLLTKEIAKKVKEEVKFPGEIKITVIRETRFQETVK